jgi:hypothetical protein
VLVQRLGAHTTMAHAVPQEEAGGRGVAMLVLQETWLQVDEDPLQLAGYTWFGHSRTVRKRGGRFSGGLGVWVLDSIASSVRSRGGVGNYGGSEGVQWIAYERKGIKRAFFNLYRDSTYFRELHGYDEGAFWSGINDDILDYRSKGYVVIGVGDLNAKIGALPDGAGARLGYKGHDRAAGRRLAPCWWTRGYCL